MCFRLLLICLPLGVIGCGARGEVAKEHVLAQVDKLLGEIDVKRKETEIGVRNIETGFDKLKRGKTEAKVRLARAKERLSDLSHRKEQVDKALARLRDYLQENDGAEINGTQYTAAAIKAMAEKCLTARKQLTAEREAVAASSKRLGSIVSFYEQRESDGRERLRRIKWHLDQIETSSLALKSIQEVNTFTGTVETLDFVAVEKQINELKTKLDVELAFQDEKWQEANDAGSSLDAILPTTTTASDTLIEIDTILGHK